MNSNDILTAVLSELQPERLRSLDESIAAALREPFIWSENPVENIVEMGRHFLPCAPTDVASARCAHWLETHYGDHRGRGRLLFIADVIAAPDVAKSRGPIACARGLMVERRKHHVARVVEQYIRPVDWPTRREVTRQFISQCVPSLEIDCDGERLDAVVANLEMLLSAYCGCASSGSDEAYSASDQLTFSTG